MNIISEMNPKYKNHFVIQVSSWDQIRVFFRNNFPCLYRKDEEGTLKHLHTLFQKGEQQIEKDFSIEKIIKNLRDLKIAVKSEMLTDELKLKV